MGKEGGTESSFIARSLALVTHQLSSFLPVVGSREDVMWNHGVFLECEFLVSPLSGDPSEPSNWAKAWVDFPDCLNAVGG